MLEPDDHENPEIKKLELLTGPNCSPQHLDPASWTSDIITVRCPSCEKRPPVSAGKVGDQSPKPQHVGSLSIVSSLLLCRRCSLPDVDLRDSRGWDPAS